MEFEMERYNASIEYLFSRLPMFSRVGAAAYKPGLETCRRLADAFGNPHWKFRSLHVAGTNGKGSTSHNLASILQEAGYKVGLYTSPHLVDFRERMRINGRMIPREKVIDFVDRWKAMAYDGAPSFFELTMMMAFEWFASEQVDVAVIEVGMGGRLDSTNIISPELCVITNISKDHTQFLGDTLEKIALEKGGIMKEGVPVVIGESEGAIRRVFETHALETGAPLTHADEDPSLLFHVQAEDPCGWRCSSSVCPEFVSPLGGEYQKANLRTVLAAVHQIRSRGLFEISPCNIADGLEKVVTNTGLSGRWMVVSRSPLTVCDTGHNEAGIRYSVNQLRQLMRKRPHSRLRIVLGFVADKDVDHILSLLPREAMYYLSNAAIPRALPVADLEKKCLEAGMECKAFITVSEAYEAAKKESADEDVLFIGGSTFIVADFLTDIAARSLPEDR